MHDASVMCFRFSYSYKKKKGKQNNATHRNAALWFCFCRLAASQLSFCDVSVAVDVCLKCVLLQMYPARSVQ
jgi:hypothetical protein